MANVVRDGVFIHKETESSLCGTQLRIVSRGLRSVFALRFRIAMLLHVSHLDSRQLVSGLNLTPIHILGCIRQLNPWSERAASRAKGKFLDRDWS